MRLTLALLAGLVLAAYGTGPAASATTTTLTAARHSVAPPRAASCHARQIAADDPQSVEPDAGCTPGATDGGLSEAQLCPVAHTSRIRPPASYTNKLKRQQMVEYGETGSPSLYEEDHLVPLELGGAPRDSANLWPQPGASPNEKDGLENWLHGEVCAGNLSLAQAQHEIATDWYGTWVAAGRPSRA